MKNQVFFTRNGFNTPVFWAAIFALVMCTLAVAPPSVDAQRRYSLKIQNNSKFDIHHLFVSSAEEDRWGPDQLGEAVIETGSAFTITDIIPGEYDIKFVDEDGDECVLKNIQIFQNKSWILTTDWLTKCEGYR